VRVPERREHRRGVRRRHDRTEEHRLEPREVEDVVGGGAREHRRGDDSDRRQERRRHGHLSQPPPRGGETALEENRRQARHADRARQLGIVELDPARAVGAEQHAKRKERDERRHPDACGAERDENASSTDRADDEQHRADVFHERIFPRRGSARLSRGVVRPPRGALAPRAGSERVERCL
jgi:hypothetical protein